MMDWLFWNIKSGPQSEQEKKRNPKQKLANHS